MRASRWGLVAWVCVCQVLLVTATAAVAERAGAYERFVTGGLKQRDDQGGVERGTWIGWTEAELVQRLGPPMSAYSHSHPRYQSVGAAPANRVVPAGATTLVYEHPRGTLFVWLVPGAQSPVCFDSLWVDAGVRF